MRTALLLLLLNLSAGAATFRTFPRSVVLGSLRDSLNGYQVLWTTSDGLSSNIPRTFLVANGYQGSGELRQDGTSGYFESEYLVYYDATATFGQWGALGIYLPTTDTNGNGVPDWLEPALACNFSAAGTHFTDYPFADSAAATMTFTRAAGSSTGTYSLRVGSVTLFGTWSLLSAEGTVTVNRALGSISFSVPGTGGNRTASAPFTLQGPNQATLAPFTVTGGGRPDATVPGNSVLLRAGTSYRGELTSSDGVPESPWPDFTRSVWEITDPVDADGDGVPDLSDALLSPPAIVRAPLPRFDFPVTPGYPYRLRGSTDLKTWTDYATHTASSPVWQYTPPAGSRAFLKLVSP